MSESSPKPGKPETAIRRIAPPHPEEICPACGAVGERISCKLVCPNCRVVLVNCSDS